ncbi:MAG: hypothetical protein IPQ07_26175 [Myxococcales bacterium]|nr:hypothetical protein [Myxococcales bacterium]
MNAKSQTPAAGGAPGAGGGGGAPKGYKRSWKNLLINKKYQLQFTLFMVGLSTLLMASLGLWVMKVANETTTVSMASVRGTPCPKVPALVESAAPDEDAPVVPMKLPEEPVDGTAPSDTPAPAPASDPAPASEPPAAGSAAGSGSVVGSGSAAPEEPPRTRTKVVMDESSMTMIPTVIKVPEDFGQKVVARWTCEMRLGGEINSLESGRLLILYVLIGTGLLLVVGLAFYGIKMTHKVAGPLFKVSLYLAKMQQGRFDKVWNLRKGDQLVDFYEHFKTAHAGVVTMEKADLVKLKAVIAAAEKAGAGEHATIVELREIVARKEKAIE